MTDRPDVSPASSSFTGLLLRVWWLFLGNGALLVVAALMVVERETLPSSLDLVFAMLVASLFAARLVDIRHFGGSTAEGAPAGMEDFWRYGRRLLAGSAAVWGGANALAAL